ncbi:MAG: RidA family protein [Acidimicrobiia bacterium]|nr:RidA family protein [Acidimicrobiia bacterium]MDH3397365.1 RidA family protein [Acidimicrobiia bacterium]
MAKKEVTSGGAPAPSGAYSQGIVAGDFLFLSGQGPFDADGNLVGGSFENEVRQVLDNLAAVAAEVGKTLADAVRVGVYLDDLATFDRMDAIYRETFPEPRPARTTIETPLLGFGIEVDAVIYIGG